MLGWFRKKLGKKSVEQEPVAAEPVEELAESAITSAESAEVEAEAEQAETELTVDVAVEAGEAEPAEEEVEPFAEPAAEDTVEEVEALAAEAIVEEETTGEEVVAEELEAEAVVEAFPEEEIPESEAEPEPEETTEAIEAIEVEEEAAAADEAEVEVETPAEPEKEFEPFRLSTASGAGREQQKPGAKSMFQRLQERLAKTRDSFINRIDSLFKGKKVIDQELFDDLEEILITADLGVTTTRELLETARRKVKRNELSDPAALRMILRDSILEYLLEAHQDAALVMPENGPFVIMVVGVNGVGKTTSIGKIAAKFKNSGQSVLLVAGDTFRAAAIDQLKIWCDRIGTEVICQKPGADPSSVVFDGIEYGLAKKYDVIIIDTAGRLHTKVNLMEELKKIKRVIGKKLEGAPHEVMLVLDATTGQNGISQAKLFNEAVTITGLTMSKLDGTAKGGLVANVCRELHIPVRFIGIGEQVDDLRDFDPVEFVDALFKTRS